MENMPQSQENRATRPIFSADDPLRGVDFIARALGPTTLVAIRPDAGPTGGFYLEPHNAVDAAAWAERLNADGCNIYYSPNLPVAGLAKKPRKEDMRAIRCVYADVDAKGGRSLEDALGAILAFPVSPSLIIASGGGFQPLWMLPEPIEASFVTIAHLEHLGARIAKLLDGDAVQNVDRILRVPFTVNYPDIRKTAAGRVPCLSGIVGSAA